MQLKTMMQCGLKETYFKNPRVKKPLGNSSFYPIDPLNQRVVQMICSTNLVLPPLLERKPTAIFSDDLLWCNPYSTNKTMSAMLNRQCIY